MPVLAYRDAMTSLSLPNTFLNQATSGALTLLGLMALTMGGCGGGGEGAAPVGPTTGTISGYVTIPGTTAAGAPSAPAPASSGLAERKAETASAPADVATLLPVEDAGGGGPDEIAPTDGGPADHVYQVIFRWAPMTTPERQAELVAEEKLEPAGVPFGAMHIYNVRTQDSVEAVQARLALHPDWMDLAVILPPKAQFVPSDSFYPYQWDMRQMGLERAWDVTRGSASVVVAVIDSGIQLNHAEFSGGRIVDGYDFVSDTANGGDGDGRDADATDEIDISVPGKHSHGTHVAGTIGANAGNGGVVGVDHLCKIMPVRVLGINGAGSINDIFDGIIYAADLQDSDLSGFSWSIPLSASRPRPTQSASVINMSLGGDLPVPAGDLLRGIYNDLLSAVKANGITIIVAAGNETVSISRSNKISMPAASPSVICVGATAPSLASAAYSNFGPEVDVVAPGGETDPSSMVLSGYPKSGGIFSTDKDTASGGFAWIQGTSMACPHVAGVCALMKAANPGLTPDQIQTILQDTAFDLGSAGSDATYGHGFVMADRAVYAAAATAPAVRMVAYTGGLHFTDGISHQQFVLRNDGGAYSALGTVTYSVVYGAGASGWISGITSTLNGTDSATIGVDIDRTALLDGGYSADLTMISTNGGSLTIPLTLVVLATPPAPSFTAVYVLLLNADTNNIVSQKALTLPGRSFTFGNVAPGRYNVYAGTDLNDDGYVDDVGEFFGVYSNNPESFDISVIAGQSRSGIVIPLTQVVAPSG